MVRVKDNPEVLEMATELSRFGLPIADMSRQLFEEHRFAYLQLVAVALQRAQLDPKRRFVRFDDIARSREQEVADLAECGVTKCQLSVCPSSRTAGLSSAVPLGLGEFSAPPSQRFRGCETKGRGWRKERRKRMQKTPRD